MNTIEVSKVRVSIVRKMFECNFSISDIGRVMNLSVNTVQRYVR